MRNNPYIDAVVVHADQKLNREQLVATWDEIGSHYDKFINMSQSMEMALLLHPDQKDYWKDHEYRHEKCNKNYSDFTMQWAGYDKKGERGELFFDKGEEKIMKKRMKKYKDKFVVLWSLSGSAYHKVYPWTYRVMDYFKNHKDIEFITVGDDYCRIIEEEGPHIFNASGEWSIRTTMHLTKHADLVIGTETGVMVAAGCFDTPKIVLLSHSSKENLTKYWKNCISLESDMYCHPCHRLHYSKENCKEHYVTGAAACMAKIKPDDVIEAIETFYKRA